MEQIQSNISFLSNKVPLLPSSEEAATQRYVKIHLNHVHSKYVLFLSIINVLMCQYNTVHNFIHYFCTFD